MRLTNEGKPQSTCPGHSGRRDGAQQQVSQEQGSGPDIVSEIQDTQGSSIPGLAKFWVLFWLTSSESMNKNSWKMICFSFIPSDLPGQCKPAGVGGKVGSPCFNLYPGQPWQHVGPCLKVFPYHAEVLTHSFLTPFVSLATQHSRA